MPGMAWLLYQGEAGQWAALAIAVAVALTDTLDGYLARKHGPTVLGSLLDPIADKLFIVALFVPFVHLGYFPFVPVALIFLRELLVTALRTAYERRGVRFRTSYLAKVKTWVQMQGAITVLAFRLIGDSRATAWVLAAFTVAVAAGAAFAWARERRFRRGPWIMVGACAAVDATLWLGGVDVASSAIVVAIVALTWLSAVDYFTAGVRELAARGRPGWSPADAARVAGAIALPGLVIAVVVVTRLPVWIPVAILAFELALGGLDNLLAHHRAAAGALEWGLRTLGTAALVAAGVIASRAGAPGWALWLVSAGLAVSVIGGVREFRRGSHYYLAQG